MTLTLVTVPNPVQQYPSGLIALRAEDFVGGARGTLTTAADGDSIAGTVVVDTQAISLATTTVSFSTRWAAASDTLSVPWATLTGLFPADTIAAYFWVSMKVAGDTTDPGGDAFTSTHLHWHGGGLGPAMGWGRDTTLLTGISSVWRSVWGAQYMMTFPEFILESDMTGTNMTMRVWGITGGDLSYSVDALYVMPLITDLGLQIFPSDFPAMSFGTNGSMFVDFDSDDSDVQFGGHHSVTSMDSNPNENFTTLGDVQQANDELTHYDISGEGTWDGSLDPPGADPKTWLSMMVAPIYLPAQNLISDPFNNTHGGVLSTNLIVTTPQRFTKTLFFGNFTPPTAGQGVTEAGGYLNAQLTGSQPGPPGPTQTSIVPNCSVVFGNAPVLDGDSNTPDKNHPLLTDLEDCIQTFSFDMDTAGVYRVFCGQIDTAGIGTATPYKSTSAFLETDGAGNLDLSLVTSDQAFIPTLGGTGANARILIDGPVNITSTFTTGVTYWVKVERQRYFWRAKCWLDGTGEPDWQVEGFEWMVGAGPTSGTNVDWVAHPYNTNWAGDANHDVVRRDPRNSRGYPFIAFEPDFNQSLVNIHVYQYDLDVDPHGASPVAMHVQETKWDDTETWDSVTLPYGTEPTWRMVEGSLRHRHFDNDSNGYNLRAWKNGGGPVLQQSAVPWLLERAVIPGGVIPLFRPRVFSVSDV